MSSLTRPALTHTLLPPVDQNYVRATTHATANARLLDVAGLPET